MNHDNDNRRPAIVANSGPLRFLSVCSGIEAASVAWRPLGWKAVAFAEIEKFPSAVLAHHYPDVPNLGDFTKIDTKTLGRVDIFCGGTPCQAFSVAGLRGGLNDERGNLTLKFVELAHELAAGNGLRNAVWENVPGVLSDKGNAFGCFLAGLVGADAAIEPIGRWTNAGMVSGPKGRAAWRILDAQYFGLAQRRRRVIVVADFGNGADPAAVLFEPESVPRHSPPSREARKDVAPTISARTKGGGGLGTDFDLDGGLVETKWPAEVASTLNAAFGEKLGLENQHINSGAPLFVPHAVSVTGDVAHTLKAEGADASEDGTERGTPIVCIHADAIGRTGDAKTPSKDAAGISRIRNPGIGIADDGTSYNLMASGQPHAVTVAILGREGGATAELGGEVATALRASQGGGDKPHVLAFQSSQSGVRIDDVHATLDSNNGSRRHNGAVYGSAVRRLTPVECERLQGFPDNYTAIPWRGKPTSPDGPRYKALGNSWAVPKFAWLGRRIQALMPALQVGAANDNAETRKAA